jgi:hypothetical protein
LHSPFQIPFFLAELSVGGWHAGTRTQEELSHELERCASGSRSIANSEKRVALRLIQQNRLTTKYKFVKPNDRNALDLMNAAALAVMKELPDLVLAYGNSDEYRYVALLTWTFKRARDRLLGR